LAITREKKDQLLKQYKENLEKSRAIFLTQSQGIPVNDMTVLRRKLREANGSYVIIKNTLTKRALNEVGLNGKEIEALLEGPVGVGFCYGDLPPVAKTLVDFAKDIEVFEIKGGLLGNTFLSEDQIKELADLPPLEVIRAQLLGVLSAPASQLVGVVASGVRQVVNVLDAYAKSAESEAA
jgi:large subunit ribosomal protein L10